MTKGFDARAVDHGWFAPWVIARLTRVRPQDRVAARVPSWFGFEYSAEAIRELGPECPPLDEVGWRCLVLVVDKPCWLTGVLIPVQALGLTAAKIGWNAALQLLEAGIPVARVEAPVQMREVIDYMDRVTHELTAAVGACESAGMNEWHVAVDQVLHRDFGGDNLFALATKVAAGNPVAHACDLVSETIEAKRRAKASVEGSFE